MARRRIAIILLAAAQMLFAWVLYSVAFAAIVLPLRFRGPGQVADVRPGSAA